MLSDQINKKKIIMHIEESKKVILVILDGWGEGDGSRSDAMANATIPFIQNLKSTAAYSHLDASGEDVGLPDGQMGNSEVGHFTIGAGRIIFQDFVRINKAVQDNSISQNKEIVDAFSYAQKNNKAVHFLGLVSDGGVHASTEHLIKLCQIAETYNLEKVFIHAFTDGRDTDPHSGLNYIAKLEKAIEKTHSKIASVCGRYYAMDRDKRWERIRLAYDMLCFGKGNKVNSATEAIQKSYSENVSDEFIKPAVITNAEGNPLATINTGDVVICFNFRTDRLREITQVLTQQTMPEYDMKTLTLYYITMTCYDESFNNIHIVFDHQKVNDSLGEVLSKAGKTQLRAAETEKYPHVTFFFSGGREKVYDGESRILIPSPKVATYDLHASMSAFELKDSVVKTMNENKFDFICMNFANSDMVGHTGVYDAIIKALETLDKCVKEICECAEKNNYSVLIIADHGNSDFAINDDGSPNTAHSMNQVPCFLIDKQFKRLENGKLSDIAPTILTLMNLPVPKAMTGKVLCKE